MIFSDAGPDVRWCGNERGIAGDPNWSAVDPSVVRFPGQSDDAVGDALQHGHPHGSVWRPAEVDVSIRPGWFYHPAQDSAVRTEEDLVQLYFTSVGRNAKLLLNVPPTRDGLLHETDAARLNGMHSRLDMMRASHIPVAQPSWRRTSARTAVAEWRLRRPAPPAVVRLGENITGGQRVARFTVEGHDGAGWRRIAAGTTIGYSKLERVTPGSALTRVRLLVEDAAAPPEPVAIELFGAV